MLRIIAVFAFAALASAPSLAQESGGNALGFAVTPPAPFVVETLPATSGMALQFGVRSTTGEPATSPGDPYVCYVGFFPQPSYAAYSQQAINDNLIGAKELTRTRMAETYDLRSFGTFTHGTSEGIEVLGVPLRDPGAGVALVMISILENPLGRVVMSCPGVVSEADTAPAIFRAIRDTITLPH